MTAIPRYRTSVVSSSSWLDEIVAEADRLGFSLMPWQLEAAEMIAALNDDGSPRFKEVVVSTPRQSGKTTLMQVVLSALAKRKPDQRLYVTAQTRIDALRHLENLGRVLGDSVKTRLSVGSERITWGNGSTLELIAPTPGGGHGVSIDAMVLDEVWDLSPHVMAGVVPATLAKPHAQLIYISTMGTVSSEVWNSLVARGRESVELPESNIAYLEYSAENDADLADESKWAEFMPALGFTQTVETVRAAMAALTPNEAIRAMANRVTTVVNNVFPSEWVEASYRIIDPPSRFVLGVDVNDLPAGASIVTCHQTAEGQFACRNVEWRYGSPIWLPHSVEQMLLKREVEAVVGDFGGPARIVFDELKALCERFHVPLVELSPRELAADTLSLFDALREGRFVQQRTEEVAQAFQAAEKRPLGDMWLVSRNRMTVDASPLIATVCAFGVAQELAVKPKPTQLIF